PTTTTLPRGGSRLRDGHLGYPLLTVLNADQHDAPTPSAAGSANAHRLSPTPHASEDASASAPRPYASRSRIDQRTTPPMRPEATSASAPRSQTSGSRIR